jgi:hypothetical protein
MFPPRNRTTPIKEEISFVAFEIHIADSMGSAHKQAHEDG